MKGARCSHSDIFHLTIWFDAPQLGLLPSSFHKYRYYGACLHAYTPYTFCPSVDLYIHSIYFRYRRDKHHNHLSERFSHTQFGKYMALVLHTCPLLSCSISRYICPFYYLLVMSPGMLVPLIPCIYPVFRYVLSNCLHTLSPCIHVPPITCMSYYPLCMPL